MVAKKLENGGIQRVALEKQNGGAESGGTNLHVNAYSVFRASPPLRSINAALVYIAVISLFAPPLSLYIYVYVYIYVRAVHYSAPPSFSPRECECTCSPHIRASLFFPSSSYLAVESPTRRFLDNRAKATAVLSVPDVPRRRLPSALLLPPAAIHLLFSSD